LESREKILQAAEKVFAEKGRHGARMEEIAGRAKVNKAMVYYFFKSKENLFNDVLSGALDRIFRHVHEGLQPKDLKGLNPAEGVTLVIQKHLEAYMQDLSRTKIVLEAFVHNPQDIKRAIDKICTGEGALETCAVRPMRMVEFFETGIAKGVFRSFDVRQVLVSITGMNLIYFVARPMAQLFLGLDAKNESRFMRDRQASIVDLLLNGILNKGALKHA
jgi:TetR/AcrR family transcriptional regulator